MATDINYVRKQLNYYWTTKGKAEKSLTQVKAAKILNISQAAFSFYLSGKNPSKKTGEMNIGTDFIRAFAQMVGVKPSDINPDLKDMNTVISGLKSSWVYVRYGLSGVKIMSKTINVHFPEVPQSIFAVEVDVDAYSNLRRGQYLIVDPDIPAQENDPVLLKQKDEVYFGELLFNGGKWVVNSTVDGKIYNHEVKQGDKVFFVSAIQTQRRDNAMRYAAA